MYQTVHQQKISSASKQKQTSPRQKAGVGPIILVYDHFGPTYLSLWATIENKIPIYTFGLKIFKDIIGLSSTTMT